MTSARHRLRDLVIQPVSRLTRAHGNGDVNTVLVFQPDHLGDIILAQPAVQIIREQFAGRHLVGVVGPWSESIARATWPVDEIVTVAFPGFERDPGRNNPLSPYLALRDAVRLLVPFNAGIAFVLRPDAWWAAWLASMVTHGPVVTSDDSRMLPFASVVVDLNAVPHATARAMAIAAGLSQSIDERTRTPRSRPLTVPCDPGASASAKAVREALGIGEQYLVLHPGAGADVKLWPANNWRKVLQETSSPQLPVLVTGSDSERALAAEIAFGLAEVHSIGGETSLPVLTELLRDASLVVGPDSGPLHLAVACGTPTVHLFGPSDQARYGPWGPANQHRVVASDWSCLRCGDLSQSREAGCGCMLSIQVETVIAVIREMLAVYAP